MSRTNDYCVTDYHQSISVNIVPTGPKFDLLKNLNVSEEFCVLCIYAERSLWVLWKQNLITIPKSSALFGYCFVAFELASCSLLASGQYVLHKFHFWIFLWTVVSPKLDTYILSKFQMTHIARQCSSQFMFPASWLSYYFFDDWKCIKKQALPTVHHLANIWSPW